MQRIDLTGQKFGRWTVLNFVHAPKSGGSRWLCRCECGNEREVASVNLRRGLSQSCGCIRVESTTTHGGAKQSGEMKAEYTSWRSMLSRCTDRKHRQYDDYGGRGITVCEEWRRDFAAFYRDMGPRPFGMTLGRIDNDRGYSKDNCRWEPKLDQARNRTNTRWVEIDGQRRSLAEWCEMFRVSWFLVNYRLNHGWDPKRALTEPSRKRKK